MRLGSIRVWGSLVKQLDMEWDEWSRVRTNGHAKGRMVTPPTDDPGTANASL